MHHRDRDDLVGMLATSLGDDVARSLVDREVAALGLAPGARIESADRKRILEGIEKRGGPPGLAARLALVRLSRGGSGRSSAKLAAVRAPSVIGLARPPVDAGPRPRAAADTPRDGVTAIRSSSPTARSVGSLSPVRTAGRAAGAAAAVAAPARVPLASITSLLARSLGDAKALEVVRAAAATLRFQADVLTQGEAEQLLELLAEQPGLVATVARFARVRLLLPSG